MFTGDSHSLGQRYEAFDAIVPDGTNATAARPARRGLAISIAGYCIRSPASTPRIYGPDHVSGS